MKRYVESVKVDLIVTILLVHTMSVRKSSDISLSCINIFLHSAHV